MRNACRLWMVKPRGICQVGHPLKNGAFYIRLFLIHILLLVFEQKNCDIFDTFEYKRCGLRFYVMTNGKRS